MSKPICSVDDCGNKVSARALCALHYGRWKRHGDPLAELQNHPTPEAAFSARTEWQGDCLVWTGAINTRRNGYGFLRVKGRVIWAHRFAWEQKYGPIPDGMEVDHICHNTACVNALHLRTATRAQNMRNLNGARKQSVTKARGVFPHGSGYRVQIGYKGKRYSFGTYPTIEEAASVAKRERARLFGDFAGRG